MIGFGLCSISARTSWRPGSFGGLPNSVISAPAMNVRPAQVTTTAPTAASAVARVTPSRRPWRTCWLSALTGGLLTVSTAMRPRRSRSTDWVMAVMVLLFRDDSRRHHTSIRPTRSLDSRPAARYVRQDGRGRRLLLVVASTDVEVDHGNSTRLDRRATGDVVPAARLGVALQH